MCACTIRPRASSSGSISQTPRCEVPPGSRYLTGTTPESQAENTHPAGLEQLSHLVQFAICAGPHRVAVAQGRGRPVYQHLGQQFVQIGQVVEIVGDPFEFRTAATVGESVESVLDVGHPAE